MSNNQRFEEATFVQTGRRSGVMTPGREGTVRHRGGGSRAKQTVPHSHVVNKYWEGHLGSE